MRCGEGKFLPNSDYDNSRVLFQTLAQDPLQFSRCLVITVLMFKNVLWKVPLKQNQNWQEANDDELAVYKPGCGAELETSEKQFAHVSYMYSGTGNL